MANWEPPEGSDRHDVPLTPNANEPRWWQRRHLSVPTWGWIVGGVLGLVAVGALTDQPDQQSSDAELVQSATTTERFNSTTRPVERTTMPTTATTQETIASTTSHVPTTAAPPTTTVAPTTSVAPTTTQPATTTIAPTTTAAPTLPPTPATLPPPPTTVVIEPLVPSEPDCDPNYTGACVPIASDVDCAGGSGNGPAYVDGPVQVVGSDIYGLDNDNDGVGCES